MTNDLTLNYKHYSLKKIINDHVCCFTYLRITMCIRNKNFNTYIITTEFGRQLYKFNIGTRFVLFKYFENNRINLN